MKTTIDRAGRIVIPKSIREQAGVWPGAPLEVRFRDGRIEIESSPLSVRVEKRGRVAVLCPTNAEPSRLTSAAVRETQRRLREKDE